MTKEEQKAFIQAYGSRVIADTLDGAGQWPDSWDGIELRRLLADRFAREVFHMERRREKEYLNIIATTTI